METPYEYVADFVKLKIGKEPTLEDIKEFLFYEAPVVYEELTDSHRWWNDVFRVVRVGYTFVGYNWAMTTGDDNPTESGWTFNINTLCFAEPIEVIKTIYKKKEE